MIAPVAKRLAQLVRMISSPSDGEVLAACRAVLRTLDGAGASIHDLADRIEREPTPVVVYRDPPTSDPRTGPIVWDLFRARECRDILQAGLNAEIFSTWEKEFATDMVAQIDARRSALFSRKQVAHIDMLLAKSWRARP